jgi:TPP-dependent pyruvate/acetoin dehydrogenase alpha subunit
MDNQITNPPSCKTPDGRVLTPDDLREFERGIADIFNKGHIRAPVHLAGGNETELIDIFQNINADDWVATQWRSHYHAILKGVPPDKLRADIMAGKSITLTYPEHRIISSAIVGGILPIALGIAASIKRNRGSEQVYAFVGDMTAMTGIFYECYRYADGHRLPIKFIVEDNGISVCTPTREVWGQDETCDGMMVDDYEYDLKSHWPHAGAGKRVIF